MKYGIKAYGQWHFFPSRKKYVAYLNEWIASTEGSERDRAVYALEALQYDGWPLIDTDI